MYTWVKQMYPIGVLRQGIRWSILFPNGEDMITYQIASPTVCRAMINDHVYHLPDWAGVYEGEVRKTGVN